MVFVLKIGLIVALSIVLSQQQICTVTNDSDILMSNLAELTGNPQENCCSICKETPDCKGFSWSASDNGTCWLKSETGPVIAKDGYSVGIILETANGGRHLDCSLSSFEDITLPGSAAYHGHSQESCYNICNTTSSCKGFIWNENEGSCWLKAGAEPLTPQHLFYVGIMTVNAIVSSDEFGNAVVANGYPRPPANKYYAFIQGLPKGSISSKQEAAMALAQFLHESDGLRAKREHRCESTGCPGEYVTPGCDAPGQHYFGRGYIQLTWCYNYRSASQYLFHDGRLISKPDSVATDEKLSWNTAFWFWKVNVHNRPGVAQGAFGATTKAINGGLECDRSAGHAIARKRYRMYGKVRAAFHLPGPGNERGCYN